MEKAIYLENLEKLPRQKVGGLRNAHAGVFHKLLMNKIQGFPLGMVYRLYNEWDILTIGTLANCGQLDFIHQLYINLKRIAWLQIGCLFYTRKV